MLATSQDVTTSTAPAHWDDMMSTVTLNDDMMITDTLKADMTSVSTPRG
jgi:hypothetical protein